MPVDPSPLAARLEIAAHELRLTVGLSGPGAIDQLCRSLSSLSDELNDAARTIGLDRPVSVPLLDLRTRIGSYVLAARALDDARPGSPRVAALLRRAVDQTLIELSDIAGQLVPVAANAGSADRAVW